MVEGWARRARPGSVGSRPVLRKRRQRALEVFGKLREAIGEVLTMHDATRLGLFQVARIATYKRTKLPNSEHLLLICIARLSDYAIPNAFAGDERPEGIVNVQSRRV